MPSGLKISIEAYSPHEDLVLEEYLAQMAALRFCFYLSGYSRVQCELDGKPFLTLERLPGQNYLAFGGANTQLTWEFAPHHPFKIVNVWLEPWLLQALSEQWQLALTTPLQQIA